MGTFGTILIAVAILVISSFRKKALKEEVIGEFNDTIDIENEENIENFSTSSSQQKRNTSYQPTNELNHTEKRETKKKQQVDDRKGSKSKFDLRKAVIYSTILDRPYK